LRSHNKKDLVTLRCGGHDDTLWTNERRTGVNVRERRGRRAEKIQGAATTRGKAAGGYLTKVWLGRWKGKDARITKKKKMVGVGAEQNESPNLMTSKNLVGSREGRKGRNATPKKTQKE